MNLNIILAAAQTIKPNISSSSLQDRNENSTHAGNNDKLGRHLGNDGGRRRSVLNVRVGSHGLQFGWSWRHVLVLLGRCGRHNLLLLWRWRGYGYGCGCGCGLGLLGCRRRHHLLLLRRRCRDNGFLCHRRSLRDGVCSLWNRRGRKWIFHDRNNDCWTAGKRGIAAHFLVLKVNQLRRHDLVHIRFLCKIGGKIETKR